MAKQLSVPIDGFTTLPKDIYVEMLQAAKRTKSGGQHYVVEDKKGVQVLRNSAAARRTHRLPSLENFVATSGLDNLKSKVTKSKSDGSSAVSASVSDRSTASTSTSRSRRHVQGTGVFSAVANSGAQAMFTARSMLTRRRERSCSADGNRIRSFSH